MVPDAGALVAALLPQRALQAAEGSFQIWLDGNLMSRRGWLDLEARASPTPGRAAVRAVYAPSSRTSWGPFRLTPGHGVPPRRGEHGPPAGGER